MRIMAPLPAVCRLLSMDLRRLSLSAPQGFHAAAEGGMALGRRSWPIHPPRLSVVGLYVTPFLMRFMASRPDRLMRIPENNFCRYPSLQLVGDVDNSG